MVPARYTSRMSAAAETLQSIESIYRFYSIPENLQTHMFQVAAIGKLVAESMPEGQMNVPRVVQTLLLHDMGNIIKYDFNRPEVFLQGAPPDDHLIAEMKKLQLAFQERFGTNPELATAMILRELAIEAEAIVLLEQMEMRRLPEVLESGSWEEKVVLYSDQRVSPAGVVSIDERIQDVTTRYPHLRERIETGRVSCIALEDQLAAVMTRHPAEITATEVAQQISALRAYALR